MFYRRFTRNIENFAKFIMEALKTGEADVKKVSARKRTSKSWFTRECTLTPFRLLLARKTPDVDAAKKLN